MFNLRKLKSISRLTGSNLLNEAISISKFKDILKDVELWDYKNTFKEQFNGKHRKIIGKYGESNGKKVSDEDVIRISKNHTYRIIHTFLASHDIQTSPELYADNTGMDSRGRPVKLVKALKKILSKFEGGDEVSGDPDDYIEAEAMLDYAVDYQTQLRDQEFSSGINEPRHVVISKHPYDVIGGSTDRDWTSCIQQTNKRYNSKKMDADHTEAGCNAQTLAASLKYPYLAAYLVKESDLKSGKDMLKKPLSRIMIYPAAKVYGEGPEFEYIMGEDIHGRAEDDFYEIVEKFVEDELNFEIDRSGEDGYDRAEGAYYDQLSREPEYDASIYFKGISDKMKNMELTLDEHDNDVFGLLTKVDFNKLPNLKALPDEVLYVLTRKAILGMDGQYNDGLLQSIIERSFIYEGDKDQKTWEYFYEDDFLNIYADHVEYNPFRFIPKSIYEEYDGQPHEEMFIEFDRNHNYFASSVTDALINIDDIIVEYMESNVLQEEEWGFTDEDADRLVNWSGQVLE
jgi:hypothetical protein